MYQLLSGKKINLGLRVWVKCGFSSAATSAFYIFKILTSTDPHFTPGLLKLMGTAILTRKAANVIALHHLQ